MRHEKRYKSCTNKSLLQNKKVFQRFPLRCEVALSCFFVILSMEKTIRISQWRCVYAFSLELFTAHLLKEKSIFYYFLKSRYTRTKKVFLTFFTTMGSSTILLLFHCEHGKNDRNESIGISLYNFCRTSNGESFKK